VRIVVTAGPTREPIDPVRFISNRSSGKMGYAIAEAAIEAGHEVTLISGPVAIPPPSKARLIKIVTADELYTAVYQHVRNCDLLVMCAAVSDYKPITASRQKVEKHEGGFALQLTATRDILASLPREDRSYFVVGFAAQTHDLAVNARKKLRAKNCDVIVANDVSGDEIGMESDDNEVTIFARDGEEKKISRASKKIIAHEILKIVFALREKSLTKKS
jgi:phosphopantothenoylcysteine decarboxylase / phosphopantothenate---cysteine ligase